MLNKHCQNNLHQIAALLQVIDEAAYRAKLEALSGSSIGQHVRHIIEFYTCLFEQVADGSINYDLRRRELPLEESPQKANAAIQRMIGFLSKVELTGGVYLRTSFDLEEGHSDDIPSSFERELAYCLEHAIHHQALIKVGLHLQGCAEMVSPEFGLAPATLRHLKQTGK